MAWCMGAARGGRAFLLARRLVEASHSTVQVRHAGSGPKRPPPIEGLRGEWVKRKDFEGRKSFGKFQCKECGNRWSSAHAYPRFRQGCKKCDEESYPWLLWVNEEKPDTEEDAAYESAPQTLRAGASPHDSARCEACKQGVCDFYEINYDSYE